MFVSISLLAIWIILPLSYVISCVHREGGGGVFDMWNTALWFSCCDLFNGIRYWCHRKPHVGIVVWSVYLLGVVEWLILWLCLGIVNLFCLIVHRHVQSGVGIEWRHFQPCVNFANRFLLLHTWRTIAWRCSVVTSIIPVVGTHIDGFGVKWLFFLTDLNRCTLLSFIAALGPCAHKWLFILSSFWFIWK